MCSSIVHKTLTTESVFEGKLAENGMPLPKDVTKVAKTAWVAGTGGDSGGSTGALYAGKTHIHRYSRYLALALMT